MKDPALTPLPRDALMSGLTDYLGSNAAEWVMCSLISEISTRELLLGKLVVNLRNVASSNELVAFLSSITPTVYVPLTLDLLNAGPLYPKMNYDTDQIEPNLLQQPKHSLVIIGEHCLVPGALNEQGLANIHALQRLISGQVVAYDYTYYMKDAEVDYRVLVLSEGKSMFKCDVSVAIEEGRSSSADLDAARDFLSTTEGLPTIDDALQELAIKHFCARRASGDLYSAEDFSRLLTISKYVAKSHKKSSVEISDWSAALSLERNLS